MGRPCVASVALLFIFSFDLYLLSAAEQGRPHRGHPRPIHLQSIQVGDRGTLHHAASDSDASVMLQSNFSIREHAQGNQPRRSQRIPENLILTGKWESLEQLSGPISKNVQKTLALNPDLRVRWLSDKSCKDYLVQHFDSELVSAFESERRGSFRGDICRAAVLSKEGGFYTDLDVEWLVPMRELVDESTTFMTVYGESDEMLNAVMAAEPGSKIMEAVLQELRKWYKPESSKQGWMGPVTLLNALKGLTHEKGGCADLDLNKHILKKSCGQHNLRLYEQRELRCNKDFVYARQHGLRLQPTPECPESRKEQSFNGLQFGLFEPGHGGKLVGWPRFAECDHWGCGGGGWSKDKGQFNMML